MLRPALLLPTHGFRRDGLSTLRLARTPLGAWLEPATGLSGDYPDGTSTRWIGAAGHALFGGASRRTCGYAFTTHHAFQLTPAGRAPRRCTSSRWPGGRRAAGTSPFPGSPGSGAGPRTRGSPSP